jgi:hypothetical protein
MINIGPTKTVGNGMAEFFGSDPLQQSEFLF